MREIKFRAVIPEKNATLYFELAEIVKPNPLFSIREILLPWLRAGNKPDRWTELLDKNGKEIYEADIIRDFKGRVVATAYAHHYARWMATRDMESCQYYLNDGISGDWQDRNMEFAEVIGNIYENPELLKEKQ